MQNMSSKWSIFVLGTTAVGKTKLSLQLAKYINGSIVSTDSKQLYRYADLLTAKATKEEQIIAKHYMIDAINLEQNSYNRNKFYWMAKGACQQIWKEQNAAIFVGGTNYYIEPMLFQIQGFSPLLQQQNKFKYKQQKSQQLQNSLKEVQNQHYPLENEKKLQELKTMSLQEKYNLLYKVDRLMWEKLHKNDEFRISSFLQRYFQSGIKPSQNYKSYSFVLNNPNTIVFWIRNSDKVQHRTIVTQRINKMLQKQGIIQILSVFTYLDNFNSQSQAQSNTKHHIQDLKQQYQALQKQLTLSGIGQSIGYKQFFPFYFNLKKNLFSQKINQQNKEENSTKKIKQLFTNKVIIFQKIKAAFEINFQSLTKDKSFNNTLIQKGKQELINNTMSYCRRQISWIKNRIFQKNQNLIKRLYILQLQQLQSQQPLSLQERFEKQIKSRAIQILQTLKQIGEEEAYQKYQINSQEFQNSKKEKTLQEWKKYRCDDCEVQTNGLQQWQSHLNSKRHKKIDKIKQKRLQNQKWIKFRNQKQSKKQKNKKQLLQQQNNTYQKPVQEQCNNQLQEGVQNESIQQQTKRQKQLK